MCVRVGIGATGRLLQPTAQGLALGLRMSELDQMALVPEQSASSSSEDWSVWLRKARYARLRDIALSISVRRTVDEAELALKLANDYSADPSILQDIDFASLMIRLKTDIAVSNKQLRRAALVPPEELAKISDRQRDALSSLGTVQPEAFDAPSGAVAEAVPKLRRVISKARELPLTIELPSGLNTGEGIDLRLALNESKNVAVTVKEVWQRLNGASPAKEEELASLQRESKALLYLRAEAVKLRGGIRLVQRQKELKSAYLVRFGESAGLLEETLKADISLSKLQKELGLKSMLLELERIYITLDSELSVSSSLVDQLLQAVERYGQMEAGLHEMVSLVQRDRHERVDESSLEGLERDIAFLTLQLGLAESSSKEKFSWERSREALTVNTNKVREGLGFYARGCQLLGQDVQLLVNMLTRAVGQGYTLRPREVKLLRRIAKDVFVIVPFVIILLIPLSPLGHVLVFSFIQRFFPDFYPSQFTESRQNIMSMYSSITSPAVAIASPTDATDVRATVTGSSLSSEPLPAADASPIDSATAAVGSTPKDATNNEEA